jgi:predicted transcriptional regulator of viral defense system
MNLEYLIRNVGDEPVFFSSLLMAGKQSLANIQLQLARWGKAGKIIQLRRGLYVLANPYRKVQAHPFLLANSIKKASYVSLQSALSFHGMIPENVPIVTSVTTARPETVNTAEGSFIFKHIKKSLFNGYSRIEVADRQSVFIATPEKSLLDLIYLTPGGHTLEYLRELRLQNFERLDLNVLKQSAVDSGIPKLESAVKQIIKIIGTEEYRDL